jgi:hypothetical protein
MGKLIRRLAAALCLAHAPAAPAFDLNILNEVTRQFGGGSTTETMRHLQTGAQVAGACARGWSR